jgi:hypothetical protein
MVSEDGRQAGKFSSRVEVTHAGSQMYCIH